MDRESPAPEYELDQLGSSEGRLGESEHLNAGASSQGYPKRPQLSLAKGHIKDSRKGSAAIPASGNEPKRAP